MADKKTFPTIPVSHWHKLRQQFKKSIPGSVTSNYIASVLGMSEGSARTNVLPSLRMIGLVDQNDTTNQALAKKFRDDSQYKEFCNEVLNQTYPREVIDAFPDSDSNRESVKTWFMNHTGVGSSAANRIVGFYFALLEANPDFEIKPTQSSNNGKKPSSENKKAPNQKIKNIEVEKAESKTESPSQGASEGRNEVGMPGLNINIQIHISSDATPDQIEKIFESMAKHIYKKL